MTGLNETAASRIRAVMAAQRISVMDYAKQTDQSIDMVSRRVNGSVELSLGDIEKFATYTGYKPTDFLDDHFLLHSGTDSRKEVAA